ncbi:MAG: AMP-binding protein [Thermonemataceae bacterium]|nr:AMP-binding protein [Thermonemataceae bacterium]
MMGMLVKIWLIAKVMKLLNIRNLYTFFKILRKEGSNLLAISKYVAYLYPQKIALIDEKTEISYQNLCQEAESLASVLHQRGIRKQDRIGILSKNNVNFVKILLAASRLGADVHLLNTAMSQEQLQALLQSKQISFLLQEQETNFQDVQSFLIEDLLSQRKETIFLAPQTSKISVFTGGTSSQKVKVASRKTKAINFIEPFYALLHNAQLNKFESVYVALPAFHGFGLAAIILALALGKKIILTEKFELEKVENLLIRHKVEVWVLVPTILQRLVLSQKKIQVACILTGGAALPISLLHSTQKRWGEIMYNLYGTSEIGFCIMAKPKDLLKKPQTLGKAIGGAKVKVEETGQMLVATSWAVEPDWIATGDLEYKDEEGYWYWKGRIDDMIISGGENVYLADIEQIVFAYEPIFEAVALPTEDKEFGQRYYLFLVFKEGLHTEKEAFKDYLTKRLARFQMPKEIYILEKLPYTAIGKPDKKGLSKLYFDTKG